MVAVPLEMTDTASPSFCFAASLAMPACLHFPLLRLFLAHLANNPCPVSFFLSLFLSLAFDCGHHCLKHRVH